MKRKTKIIGGEVNFTTKIIGGEVYILPFRAVGCWIEDAVGKNVAECYTAQVAKALADILNEDC